MDVGGWNQEFCVDKLGGRNVLVIHPEPPGRELDVRASCARCRTISRKLFMVTGSILEDAVTAG